MPNDDFTYKIASLGNGELKRAVSLVIKIKTDFSANTAQISSFVFKSTIVKNLALSYSEADNYIKSKSNHSMEPRTQTSLKLLNKLARILMNIEAEDDLPATKMVEHFMLMYNSLCAETLFGYNKQTILRSHKKTPQSLIDKSTPELNEFINRLNQNAAKYVIDHESGC